MAQRVITQLISDLSGDEIAAGKGETVQFSYRGNTYSIDLTDKEAAGFDKAIAMYFEHATKTGGRRKTSSAGSKSDYNAKDVRAWARPRAWTCWSVAGSPATVVERYRAAR